VKSRVRSKHPGQEEELKQEHKAVASLLDASKTHPDVFSRLDRVLGTLKDPFHAINLLHEEKTLTPPEVFVLAHLAYSVGRVRTIMAELPVACPERTVPPPLEMVEARLFPGFAGQPVFYVSDSYLPELSRVRAERKAKERLWRAEMTKEAIAAERVLGRRPGLREEVAIRKTNAAAIEEARLMPELGETRETLTHVHFRLKATREALRLEREMSRLRQKETALEGEVLGVLSAELRERRAELEKAAWALGELDYLLRKVELALKWGACVPVIRREAGPLVLEGAFHPRVREDVEGRGGRYQPLSLTVDFPVSVVTGPNMGGKTVSLATVGLCVSLAQWGFLPPCSRMEFSLYDYVYFHPETHGKPGLSSFAAEIVAMRDLLSRVSERGLILLDEVGRGTNPTQGLALYAAILDYLRRTSGDRSTVIASTHFHGLAAALDVPHWQVAGLMAHEGGLQEAGVSGRGAKDLDWLYRHMDYTLLKVGPDTPVPQDALLVARVLGLDGEIIRRAETFVAKAGSFDSISEV
jgi:DNA mismatch repair protein MutS2